MSDRVVITGLGAISPLGLDVPSTWDALVAGRSGIDRITLFDATDFATKIAAEVKDFIPTDYVNRKEARHMDRFAQLAVAASREAANQAKLELNSGNEDTVGIIIGSGIGGLGTLSSQFKVLSEKGPSAVNPFLIPMMMSNSASAQVSMALGARGPNLCISSACSSGADAIGESFELIKRGDVQVMIVGGSEAVICPIGVAGFNAVGALSTRNDNPKAASRPFDRDRDGFVIGEGAAVLVLESLPHAQRRGVEILGEIIGYGASSDAYHITHPREGGEGGAQAMRWAMQRAGIKPEDVGYVNAHGTSTLINDKNETMALKSVLGQHAYHVPVGATKSMTGHLIGAAGAIEAIICLLAIKTGVIPPTINLDNPDPDCDLDYVPGSARHFRPKVALSNSFGFGGHNSVLAFREYTEG